MSRARFDQKFGSNFWVDLPDEPGVYRFIDVTGEVIYVGKAKSLRKRLGQYRNASRRKVHRKMRTLVREADRVEFDVLSSEEAALLRESELIRELQPAYNVEGAYAFLYPSLGVGVWDKHLLLCFTTRPEEFSGVELAWYGCFRSRPRVKAAFDALVEVLMLIGHMEKAHRLPEFPRIRGSRLVGFRQIPVEIQESLPWFFAGEERTFPGEISRLLLAKPRARREAVLVEERLKLLMLFYQADALKLREALRAVGRPGSHISQQERDSLFIRSTFAEPS